MNLLRSTLYKLLLNTSRYSGERWWQLLWHRAIIRSGGIAKTKIHGYPAIMNIGYTYPVFSRQYKTLNNPIIELAYLTFKAKNRPLNIIDIGAAIGDTFLLLKSNLPNNSINKIYCIDGDEEFLKYLQTNLKNFEEAVVVPAILSDIDSEMVPKLVRIHGGTASAQGTNTADAKSLDTVCDLNNINNIDFIKIDVDGFDGKVLSGAQRILKEIGPDIIFEYHPILVKKTGNSFFSSFEALQNCGYQDFLWFSKYGTFNHFLIAPTREEIEFYTELSLRNNFDYDLHFDVVALSPNSEVNKLELAEMIYAGNKRSSY